MNTPGSKGAGGLDLVRPFAEGKRGALERRLAALESTFEHRALSELQLSAQTRRLLPGAIGNIRAWLALLDGAPP